jgi:hypothetical protein
MVWFYGINIQSLKKTKMTNYKHCFDFDVGYLVKSPCKNCESRPDFPGCSEHCEIIDKIHGILCGTISSTKGFSSLENFAISMESWGRK